MNIKGSPPLRPLEYFLLVVGGLGWTWGLILILGTALTLERGDRTAYPVGQLGMAFAGTKPVDRELLSPSGTRLQGHGTCSDMWFDEDAVLIRGIGPMNGSNAPAWLTLTVGSQVFVGRVTVDLWNGVGAGTGGLDSSSNFIVANNLRFVERVPPPRPGPPGWRVIRPGECVLGSTEPLDASGVIGRFLIDLPAARTIGIDLMPEAEGEYIPKAVKLTLDGQDVRMVQEDEFKEGQYRPEREGRYELTVLRTDGPDAGREAGRRWRRYTIAVDWGASIRTSCSPPDSYGNCFIEVQP
jgi:hypothetical protein